MSCSIHLFLNTIRQYPRISQRHAQSSAARPKTAAKRPPAGAYELEAPELALAEEAAPEDEADEDEPLDPVAEALAVAAESVELSEASAEERAEETEAVADAVPEDEEEE